MYGVMSSYPHTLYIIIAKLGSSKLSNLFIVIYNCTKYNFKHDLTNYSKVQKKFPS